VALLLQFGVDYRLVEASYIGQSFSIAGIGLAPRLFIPFLVGVSLTLALYVFLMKTFYGRAVLGVSQDSLALRLMGADPIKIKSLAFGLGVATASLAGALLIIIGPIEPSSGREYIGRAFAIAVLGGVGSLSGTLIAALILGVVESLTSTIFGPSWALAVSFGMLLLVLAVRPAGLFGR
jgi:branched-chain amino acid transport system permease protein